LQGEHGDEATIENREQLRNEFAEVILRSILKQQLPIIHSDDFTSCVTRTLMKAPHKFENRIDCNLILLLKLLAYSFHAIKNIQIVLLTL